MSSLRFLERKPRFDRSAYSIPVHVIHRCGSSCGAFCTLAGPPDALNLSDYHIDNRLNILTNGNYICNLDEIVIRDTKFTFVCDYPLKDVVDFTISGDRPFTLRKLLWNLKRVYETIYECEEITSSTIRREFVLHCSCPTHHSRVLSKDYDESKNAAAVPDGDCGICYMPFDSSTKILTACNHAFRNACLEAWIEKGNGKTCPFCRAHFVSCGQCNNTSSYTYEWLGKVIPIECREMQYHRNITDGCFKVQSVDFDNLYLSSMAYDNRTKKLYAYFRNDVF